MKNLYKFKDKWNEKSYVKKVLFIYIGIFILLYLTIAIHSLFVHQLCFDSNDEFVICSFKGKIYQSVIEQPKEMFITHGLIFAIIPNTVMDTYINEPGLYSLFVRVVGVLIGLIYWSIPIVILISIIRRLKKKKLDNRKMILRVFFYLAFILGGIGAIIKSTKGTSLPFSATIVIYLITILILIGFAELFVWFIYKILTWINYFGLKKPPKYEKDIKRFALMLIVGSIIGYSITMLLISLKILPATFDMFWRDAYWWLVIVDVLYFVSLIGLYKLKNWALHLYIITNIAFQIEFTIFSFQGLSGISTSVLMVSGLIAYPYIRKGVLK
jgi:hypothetical protein